MDKHTLAQQLRELQYAHGYLLRHIVDAVSDDDIIDSYITCSCCGEKRVPLEQLETVIAQARNVPHFFEICDARAGAVLQEHTPLPTPDFNKPTCLKRRRRRK